MKNIKKSTLKIQPHIFPFVSVCTPTFNRRPFIKFMIQCFEHQTYPKDKIEWIIVDDGTDPIKDLVEHMPQVKYFYYDDKMLLGKKRNLMHTKCSGDIIIYMDDDDYYPPDRISHAVETLQQNPTFLIAGSSEMHIYFESENKIYKFGPYKEFHSTAATFAFKKELLNNTNYDDDAALAEERQFLKNYTIPLKQLNPLKSILVFSTMGTSKSHNLKYLISLLNIKNDIINLFCINLENLKLDTRSLYTSLRFPSSFIAKSPYEIYKNVDFTEFLNDVYYFLHSIECTLNKIIYSNRMEKRAKELGF